MAGCLQVCHKTAVLLNLVYYSIYLLTKFVRIETANLSRDSQLVLNPASEETIQTILFNDLATIKAAYPDFGDKCWCNGFLEEAYATSVINSLEEVPFPNFSQSDDQGTTLVKAVDVEWNVPRAHLCFWINNNAMPTAGATTSNPGNWAYIGKISLLNNYGYPERKHRWFDFFTDNVFRKLGQNTRIGCSFQWVDRVSYRTLNSVAYTPDPTEGSTLVLSRFSETLPVLTAGINYQVRGFRVTDGSPIPVEPTYNLSGNVLTVSFTHESRVQPGTIKAILYELGNKVKLTTTDIVTIDAGWTQEIVSIQPDFTPTPIVAQSVSQVTRSKEQTIYTVTTARQTVLTDRSSRISGQLANRGVTNNVYYKLGADVTTSPLIQAGQTGVTGGYHGIISTNSSVALPAGYTGTISVVTASGQSQLMVEETYLLSGA